MMAASLSPSRRWGIFSISVLGIFMAALDTGIVNVALPALSRSLRVPHVADLQWVLTAYTLVTACLLLVCGKMGDLWGRRIIYLAGMVTFTAGTICCGLSTTLSILILSRMLQAAGGAMMMANALAIVAETFTGRERTLVLGYQSTITALGLMAGPGLGGLLLQYFSWPMLFWINIPPGILGIIGAWWLLPPSKTNESQHFDFRGSCFFTLGMLGILLGLSQEHDFGFASPLVWGSLSAGILFMWFFFRHEKTFAYPLLDLSLFQKPGFGIGIYSSILLFTASYANNLIIPFYLVSFMGLSPAACGLLLMIYPAAVAIISPFTAWLSDRLSPHRLIIGCLILFVLGLSILLIWGNHPYLFIVSTALFLIGLANGLFVPLNNTMIIVSAGPESAGIAGSCSSLARYVGLMLGTVSGGAIYEGSRIAADQLSGTAPASSLLAGYHYVLLFCLAIILITCWISLRRNPARPVTENHPLS